jgi:putative transposase
MRAADIVGCHRRKRSFSITQQNPKADVAPDRVDRKFVATAPNQLWVADVTYVPTLQGWLYLACVTDVFSRLVIGWSMASNRKTDLVVDAVTMAVHRRGGHVPGVIHHSDRSGEYSSHALERELRRHGALASMGSVADCFDNALAESVFATLECELFDQQPHGRFTTRREAKLAVFYYLETFYNPRRRHSALGHISSAAFEAQHALTSGIVHAVSLSSLSPRPQQPGVHASGSTPLWRILDRFRVPPRRGRPCRTVRSCGPRRRVRQDGMMLLR